MEPEAFNAQVRELTARFPFTGADAENTYRRELWKLVAGLPGVSFARAVSAAVSGPRRPSEMELANLTRSFRTDDRPRNQYGEPLAPFGTVAADEKRRAGAVIAEWLRLHRPGPKPPPPEQEPDDDEELDEIPF